MIQKVKYMSHGITQHSFQKAEAQLAYELQAAKIQQRIRNEEIQIQVRNLIVKFIIEIDLFCDIIP